MTAVSTTMKRQTEMAIFVVLEMATVRHLGFLKFEIRTDSSG